MALLTAPEERAAAAGSRSLGPALRLWRTGDDRPRIVPLAAGKSTIGSSPQCQICLPSGDVRPLQCLLTLNSAELTATRWSPGARLNGHEFSRAALSNGDLISLGAWQLEVSGLGAPRPVPLPASGGTIAAGAAQSPRAADPGRQSAGPPAVVPLSPRTTPARPTPDVATTTATRQALADRLILHLWTANHQTRRRAKALVNGIRAARFSADAMAADLAAMETELDLARAAYDSYSDQEGRLQQELAEQRRLSDERVTPLLAEIAAIRAQLDETQSQLSQQQADYEKLVQDAASEDAAPTVGAPATGQHTWQLEADLRLLAEQHEETVRELAAVLADRDRLAELYRGEPASGGESGDSLAGGAAAAGLHLQSSAPVTGAATEATCCRQPLADIEPAPPSFIERYRHLLEEADVAAPEPAGAAASLDEEFLSPVRAAASQAPQDDSDEALEAYMASMMLRVRGNDATPAVACQRPVEPCEAPPSPESPDWQQTYYELRKPVARKPMAAADMTALREIANVSARTAIATHSRRCNQESAASRSIIAVLAGLASAYVVGVSPVGVGWQFWSGVALGVVGIGAALQVLLLGRRTRTDQLAAAEAVQAQAAHS
jgi:hypothetical protein